MKLHKKTILSLLFFVFMLVGFLACENNAQLTKEQKSAYLKKGQSIAQQTFGVLSGQLQKAMARGGVQEAISYCNLAAHPLVDSLSETYNARIKRTSLQIRNPDNRPSNAEEKILKYYVAQIKSGEKIQPIIEQHGDVIAFFAPIKINVFCLQCHGERGKSLSEENFAILQEFYPQDQAIGYGVNDLRGIWSIKLLKNELMN